VEAGGDAPVHARDFARMARSHMVSWLVRGLDTDGLEPILRLPADEDAN
jgi:hypothetical protein